MIEILLILVLITLILILRKIKKFWEVFLLLNFSIYEYKMILEIKKEADTKRNFLKKQEIDTINNDPKDCTVTINGKEIPYLGYLGTIESGRKMAEIFLEGNLKAKSGISRRECINYVDKRFKEEKIK